MKLKRLLAFCLTLVMIFSLLPLGTMAEETQPTEAPTTPATTAPTEEPTVPTTAEPPVPGTTEAPVPQTTEEAVPQTTEEPAPSEGSGILDGIVDFFTGDDKKEENPDVTTSDETTAATEATVPAVTEETVPQTTEAPVPVILSQALVNAESLQSMVDAVAAHSDQLGDLTEQDVLAVEAKMAQLYRSLSAPTSLDADNYYAIMNHMLELRGPLGMCICGSSTADHGSFCPRYNPGSASNAKSRMRNSLLSAASAAVNSEATSDNPSIITNKKAEKTGDNKFMLTMEAYATGTAVTTVSTKPADIVLVVDQSASMLYGDSVYFNSQPGYDTVAKGGLTREYMNTDEAKAHGKFGLYYLAYGQNTLCFMVYRDNKWMYFDTFLAKHGNTHTHRPDLSGQSWDALVQYVLKDWDYFENNLHNMTETTWSNFQKYGIYPTRMGPVYEALVQFVNDISDDGVDHRISVVGFGGRDEDGSELFIDGVGTQRSSITSAKYQQALVNVQTGKQSILNSVNALLPNMCWTHHDSGFKMANGVFENNAINLQERDRIVVFFSDGEGSTGRNDLWSYQYSHVSKNTHKAYVYSIGISLAPPELMNQMSSNFPTYNGGSTAEQKDTKYYIHATNSEELMNAFASISSTVAGTTVELTQSSFIQDVVTKYFEIPDGAGSVRAYTVECTGYSAQETPEWSSTKELVQSENIKIDGNTVTVTGFNYAHNFVSKGGRLEGTTDKEGNFHGRKLVLEVDIVPKQEFLGGNHVITNESTSGLYDGEGNLVESFPVPEVDVKTDAELTVKSDIYIYLGSVFHEEVDEYGNVHYGLSVSDLKDSIEVGYGHVDLNMSRDDFGLDPDMSKYVTVKVDLFKATEWHLNGDLTEFTWSDEPVIAMDEILWDTPYKIRVRVEPLGNGECKPVQEESIGWIHVFYPEITFKDAKEFYYGELPASEELIPYGTVTNWINKSIKGDAITSHAEVTMTMPRDGKPPEVTYSCSVPVGMTALPKTDVPVQVMIDSIGYTGKNALSLNQFTLFKWADCTPSCGHNIPEHQGYPGNQEEFYIHPQTCTLTIEKTGADTAFEAEPYLFNVYKNGAAAPYTQASITGNGSVTISELPVGTYTLGEDMNWSWRYDSAVDGAATLSSTSPAGTIAVTNTLKTKQWFNDYSDVVTNTYGVPIPKN